MTAKPATVQELWRFPVKSMQGECIDASEVTSAGLVGDRAYAVIDADNGKVGSAKHPRLWGGLLQCVARYDTPPVVGAPVPAVTIRLPDGGETGSGDPEVDRRLSDLLGHPVRLSTAAPDGSAYFAVWPDMDGVIPDEYLQQVSVDAPEPDGTLTELSLALGFPPGDLLRRRRAPCGQRRDAPTPHGSATRHAFRGPALQAEHRDRVIRSAIRREHVVGRHGPVRDSASGDVPPADDALHHDDARPG